MEGLLLGWFAEHGRDLPWRRTRDPYAILVSEVMLQQTQVERVIPRYLAWLERWPTVSALAAASPADVIREIPFNLAVVDDSISSTGGLDQVMLRGRIDLWFEEACLAHHFAYHGTAK